MARKSNITKQDLKEAIEICECDIQEISVILDVSVRHAYRLLHKLELKDYFFELKSEIATENSISDLTKDVIVAALLDMKTSLKLRSTAIENKAKFIPYGLTKQDIQLLIFTAKSKAGFVENEKKIEELEETINEHQNAIASAVELAKKEFIKEFSENDS